MSKRLGGLLVSKEPWQGLLPCRARTMLVAPGEERNKWRSQAWEEAPRAVGAEGSSLAQRHHSEAQRQLRSTSSFGWFFFASRRKYKADRSHVLLLCSPFATRKACSKCDC